MKKFIFTLLIIIALTNNSFSAGTSSDSSDGSTNYTKAKNLIKAAKKYEKKGKTEKAVKRYTKAQKLLLKSNEKKPLQADTLNYLGFTTRKLGDYEKGEEFYLLLLLTDLFLFLFLVLLLFPPPTAATGAVAAGAVATTGAVAATAVGVGVGAVGVGASGSPKKFLCKKSLLVLNQLLLLNHENML